MLLPLGHPRGRVHLRALDAAPDGRQRDGTSAWRSRPGYPYTVWSLLEMAREDIIEAMDAESVFGACDGV